jgi:hypothetical protein
MLHPRHTAADRLWQALPLLLLFCSEISATDITFPAETLEFRRIETRREGIRGAAKTRGVGFTAAVADAE